MFCFSFYSLLLLALFQQPCFSQIDWILNVIFPPASEPRELKFNDTSPVVLVPGWLGNQLEAKLDKPSVIHWLCYRKTDDYFIIWLNLNVFFPVGIDCWTDNMRILYNRTSRRTYNAPGVEIRVPGFGETETVEYLDDIKLTGYMHTLVQELVNIGYVRGKTIRGAPYDWRIAPNEQEEYFAKMKKLIEEMYEEFQKPVTLIGHSLGNMYVLYFFQEQTQDWKDKHIRAFISLGSPWGGLTKSLQMLVSGENHIISLVGNIKIREDQMRKTTSPWIIPTYLAWPEDHVFIATPSRNYTYRDYYQLFSDIGYLNGWYIWEDNKDFVKKLPPPGVETHCLYGTGIPTEETYVYSEEVPNKNLSYALYADGDGTVNTRSLALCKLWHGRQKQAVHIRELKGIEHLNMVYHNTTLDYIKNVLLQDYEDSLHCTVE